MLRNRDIRTEAEFDAAFPDEKTCHDEMYDFKWPNGCVCPDCGNDKMTPNGKKQFQCSKCRCSPSVRSGTIFQDGKLTLRQTFKIIFYTCTSEERLSAAAIARRLGVKKETVRNNQHKIRVAMADPLGSVPIVDPVARTLMSLGGVVDPSPWPEFPGFANPFVAIYWRNEKLDVASVPPVYEKERADGEDDAGPTLDQAVEQVLLMVEGGNIGYEGRNRNGQGHAGAYADRLLDIGLDVRAWLRDTYRCAVSCHLPKYLVEFAVRYNYQRERERLFATVLGAVVAHRPVTYREIVEGGKSPRAQSMILPVLAPG